MSVVSTVRAGGNEARVYLDEEAPHGHPVRLDLLKGSTGEVWASFHMTTDQAEALADTIRFLAQTAR